MPKITNWKARQVGGAITIDGFDNDGNLTKVRAKSIERRDRLSPVERRGWFSRRMEWVRVPVIFAILRDGSHVELA